MHAMHLAAATTNYNKKSIDRLMIPSLTKHEMKPNSAILLLLLLLLLLTVSISDAIGGGNWELLQRSIGVSAMHMQLLHNDKVIIFDRTDFGPSNISLPNGYCRHDPNDLALPLDCTAHSVEYDALTNTFRPLTILTDPWCSSATVAPNGTLIQTGGFNDGDRAARTFTPCSNADCDWVESPSNDALAVRRWYATNQILTDGRAIIVGGRRQFSYEFYPKAGGSAAGATAFPFLRQTRDPEENNLYPFVHLNVDGHLFIFANNRSILFDYRHNTVIRTYPHIPGGDPRNYPSSGSSVLLPLQPPWTEAEVLVCGGAPAVGFVKANNNSIFVPAVNTCGRMKITDQSPSWETEAMPMGRVMGDMVILPTGDVLVVNGAGSGAAGWENAREPVKTPVLYRPDSPTGSRFSTMNPAEKPRMYHSTAVLLRDGRVLVGGSNPHKYYNFTGVEFPTELSLEAFSPEYIEAEHEEKKPKVSGSDGLVLDYGKLFKMRFEVGTVSEGGIDVTMVAPPFATHSYSMNQRLLVLGKGMVAAAVGVGVFEVEVAAPAAPEVAPTGYYMVFVVNGGIPSEGVWARIQ